MNIENSYKSESEKFREEANNIYKSCTDNLNATIIKDRLYKAINLYESARKSTQDKDEYFKNSKNIFLSYLKLINKWKNNINENSSLFEECFYFSKQCLINFIQSFKFSQVSVRSDLISKISEVLHIIYEIINNFSKIDFDERMGRLLILKDLLGFEFEEVSSILKVIIARSYFNHGINLFEKGKVQASNSLFHNSLEFSLHVLENRKVLNEATIEEAMDIEESSQFYLKRSSVNRLIEQGDKYFSMGVNEQENIDMDSIYLAVDKFREGLMLIQSREFIEGNYAIKDESCDIETEAILYSRLGVIFYFIFKNEIKTELLIKQSIDLGLSLMPKNVEMESWFKKAKEILNEIREKKRKAEEKLDNETREKIMKENQSIFDELDKQFKNSSTEKFIEYILTNHCPNNEKFRDFKVGEEIEKSGIKKVLLKLIPVYHPDKTDESDLKKKVIFDEICKLLNAKYSYFKE